MNPGRPLSAGAAAQGVLSGIRAADALQERSSVFSPSQQTTSAWQSDLAFLHEKYYIHYRDAVICTANNHIGKRDDIAPGTTIFLRVPKSRQAPEDRMTMSRKKHDTTPVAAAAELAYSLLGEDDAKPVSETRADWVEVLTDTPAPDSRHIFSPTVGNLVCERIIQTAMMRRRRTTAC
jgi:hypothetical protein